MDSESSELLLLLMQTATDLESCRRLLIQCVAVCRATAFVSAKSVNTGDNMEAIRDCQAKLPILGTGKA